MNRFTLLALGIVFSLHAQETAPAPQSSSTASGQAQRKQVRVVEVELPKKELERIAWTKVSQAARTSPIDYQRALEEYLLKFPDTTRRPEIERSLAQSAIEQHDRERILRYGQAVLKREPNNLRITEFVTRALLDGEDEENSKKALGYARRIETSLRLLELQMPESGPQQADVKARLSEGISRALVFESRAQGNLGNLDSAVKLAIASFKVNPTSEAAREAGRWLVRAGRDEEALHRFADAFAMDDTEKVPRLKAHDRQQLKELYLKTHDSETGLGDLILAAYDRTHSLLEQRRRDLLAINPNLDAKKILDFVLSGLDGESLALESLHGKVVVLDFWATWCKPCRVQQPLYEKVRDKFADHDDVVFLNINTDRDRDIVKPFLDRAGWDKNVYFEDGLKQFLQVNNIPTTILIGKDGKLAGRMIGFSPDHFVDMLAERIERALFLSSAKSTPSSMR